MEVTVQSVNDRKAQLIGERDRLLMQVNMVMGAIAECETLLSYMSLEAVPQEEMPAPTPFPASDSR